MKILLLFTLCLISDGGAADDVIGYSGGGVLIKCKYDRNYTQKSKYFCKDSGIHCLFQIQSGVKGQWVSSGRFSLFDDSESAEFWVMIRELTVQDTGIYQCGVDLNWDIDVYTSVMLNVETDPSYVKSISETVSVGEDLTLSCEYPESLRSNPKFLCRMRTPDSACSYEDSVRESRKSVNLGKFLLYEDRAKKTLSVTIRNLTEQDAGELWCGAEVNWGSDHGYKVYFTHINLRVSGAHKAGSTSITVQPSSSSVLTPASPPAAFPVSTVISVSVIVVLLLPGILILIVFLQKRRRIQGSKTTKQTTREDEDPPHVHPLSDLSFSAV